MFEGFEEPKTNWIKLPHSLIDNLHLIKSLAELKVILYILRHTWGYDEEYKRISLDEFENGRKHKNGRIDNGIGMTKPSIIKGIKKAIGDGFIVEEVDNSDEGRIEKYYALKARGGKETLQGGVKKLYTVHRKKLKKETNNNKDSNNNKKNNTTAVKKFTLNECLQYYGKPDDERLIADHHATTWILCYITGGDVDGDFRRFLRYATELQKHKHKTTGRTADLIYELYNENAEFWQQTYYGTKGWLPNQTTIKNTIEDGIKFHKGTI